MARTRKSWQEKLADAKAKPGLPKEFYCRKSRQHFVVASPEEIEQIIRTVKRGELVTIAQIGQRLKVAHDVDVACPITTGIFTWLIANAAQEATDQGRKGVPPWWRVLKTGGLLNPKFPGGGRTQKAMLQAEGHKVVPKGKALIVANYEDALVRS